MSYATQRSHLYAGGDTYGQVPQHELLEAEDEGNMESENQLLSNEEMNPDFRGEPGYSNSETGF